jgi:FRG domain-containing protein
VADAAVPTHVEPSSWENLLSLIAGSPRTWIWRGQRDYSWTLLTKLGRDLRRVDPDRRLNWQDLENSAIGFFMDRASGLLKAAPDEHDLLGWLSFMQHYGAPTRLLDWSFSPFVAVYFAYEQPTNSDSSIYALNTYLARRANVRVLFPKPWDHLGVARVSTSSLGEPSVSYPARNDYRRDRENRILRWAIEAGSKCPLPTIPFRQDERMAAQQAVLTLMGDVDTEVDIWFDKEKWEFPKPEPRGPVAGTDSTIWPLNQPGDLITKVRLRPEWRDQALEALTGMGISASTMFPGLDGIGRATSSHLLTGKLTVRDILTGWIE